MRVLIRSRQHSLVSSSQNDPSENENLMKNTAKTLNGNREGVDIGANCRAQRSVTGVRSCLVEGPPGCDCGGGTSLEVSFWQQDSEAGKVPHHLL